MTIRRRSREKRISSRCQTILIARSSPRDAARGNAHARDLVGGGRGRRAEARWRVSVARRFSGAIIRATLRMRSVELASASRIVVPV